MYESFTVSHADGNSLLLDGEFSDTGPELRGPRVVTGWTDANLLILRDGERTKVDSYSSTRTSLDRNEIPDSATAGATAVVNFTVTIDGEASDPIIHNWVDGLQMICAVAQVCRLFVQK